MIEKWPDARPVLGGWAWLLGEDMTTRDQVRPAWGMASFQRGNLLRSMVASLLHGEFFPKDKLYEESNPSHQRRMNSPWWMPNITENKTKKNDRCESARLAQSTPACTCTSQSWMSSLNFLSVALCAFILANPKGQRDFLSASNSSSKEVKHCWVVNKGALVQWEGTSIFLTKKDLWRRKLCIK